MIFARTPVPGRVKTRLLTRLSREQACQLHQAMIEDTAQLAMSFPGRRLLLFSEEIVWLDLPPGIEVSRQGPGNLGERLIRAIADGFMAGAQKVVVLGSDSPHLPRQRLRQALEALENSDLVIGPTKDGGYYLIGLRRFSPAIFEGIEWGSVRVFEQTRCAAEQAGFSVSVLERFYDLDTWEDLKRLADSHTSPRSLTVAALLRHLTEPRP